MRFTVKVRGIEVGCDEPADIEHLLELAGANGLPPATERRALTVRRRPGRPPNGDRPAVEIKREEARIRNLQFLRLIQGGGSLGILTCEIVRQLDLPGPKALGGVAGSISKALQGSGIDKNEVCRASGPAQKRRWKAGRRIAEAIKELQDQKGGDTE